jgi:predicted MPP superfamily phosphohydrolase
LSANTKQPNFFGRLFIAFLRHIVQTPLGIRILSVTRYLDRTNPTEWVDTNSLEIDLPGLPDEFDGYRLVQISDFHLGTWFTIPKLFQVVEKVNNLQPDLVVITGDFVTINPEQYVEGLAAGLSNLLPQDATLAILGNHDHWSNAELIRSALKSTGVIELNNDIYPIKRNGKCLYFAGIDDFMVGKDRLDQILTILPEEGCTILLAHEPDFADFSACTKRFVLQLSGHSHGGQIVLPRIGPVYLPRFGRKYPSGLYQVNGMLVYTNNGLGTAELQFRVNCPPEITVIDLKSRN